MGEKLSHVPGHAETPTSVLPDLSVLSDRVRGSGMSGGQILLDDILNILPKLSPSVYARVI